MHVNGITYVSFIKTLFHQLVKNFIIVAFSLPFFDILSTYGLYSFFFITTFFVVIHYPFQFRGLIAASRMLQYTYAWVKVFLVSHSLLQYICTPFVIVTYFILLLYDYPVLEVWIRNINEAKMRKETMEEDDCCTLHHCARNLL